MAGIAWPKGLWVEPTLIAPRSNDSEVVQNEVFGPVLTFQTFRDEAEGVALANSTRYGLSAIVYTGSAERAERVGARCGPASCGSTHSSSATSPRPSVGSGSRASGARAASTLSTSTAISSRYRSSTTRARFREPAARSRSQRELDTDVTTRPRRSGRDGGGRGGGRVRSWSWSASTSCSARPRGRPAGWRILASTHLPGNQDPATPWPSSLVLALRDCGGHDAGPAGSDRRPCATSPPVASRPRARDARPPLGGASHRAAHGELAPRRVRRARASRSRSAVACWTSISLRGLCSGVTRRRRLRVIITGSTTCGSSQRRGTPTARDCGSAARASTHGSCSGSSDTRTAFILLVSRVTRT